MTLTSASFALGRFTREGGTEVEARIRSIMDDVRGALAAAFTPEELRAAVLLGGYGRGEGGVETRAGEELPHNNFDFLVVLTGGDAVEGKARAHAALSPLSERHGIGMDVGAITARALESSPCLVMWFDMRFGHKTVLGDPSYVPSLRQFSLERIPAWDVRNLLTNRGTLLLINRLLLERGDLREEERRTVVKHAMKAIIGFGDAALFFEGLYDWSYVEKQRRMREATMLPSELRALYEEATRFRFRPRYDAYLSKDLAAWNRELFRALAPVHLRAESARMGERDLTWANYLDTAFRHELRSGWTEPRRVAKKLLALPRSKRAKGLSLVGALGQRTSRLREMLPVLFPAVAYEAASPDAKSAARDALSARTATAPSLTRAYLAAWGGHGDTNFENMLRKLGVELREK